MSLRISYDGNLVWTNKKGQSHREKGPAFISTHDRISYRINGRRHRLDGPALIYYNGNKYYWIDGSIYTKEAYYAKVRKL